MDCLTDSTSELVIKEDGICGMPVVDDDNADLILKTSNGTLKAHKEIVRCCPYFAVMIDGNWRESQSSVITLNGYSYKSVRFVIEHLYIPKKSINIDQNLGELLALTDMLGLQTLVELICSTLITKLCHNFHKPCKDCIDGVLNSLQLASTYCCLGDLYTKCLAWQSQHFIKTWNSRSFANLPKQIQSNCLECVKETMTVENVIDLSLRCQQLQEMLPSVKWAEPVSNLVKQLSASCLGFIQEHFHEILISVRFSSLNHEDTWSVNRVEAVMLEAATNIPVEQACLSYLALENILNGLVTLKKEDSPPDPDFLNFIKLLHKAVETRLIQRVGLATKCSTWNALPQAKQKSIMQMGFFDPVDNRANFQKLSSKLDELKNTRKNLTANRATESGKLPHTRTKPVLNSEQKQKETLQRKSQSGKAETAAFNRSQSSLRVSIRSSLCSGTTSASYMSSPVKRSQSARTTNISSSAMRQAAPTVQLGNCQPIARSHRLVSASSSNNLPCDGT